MTRIHAAFALVLLASPLIAHAEAPGAGDRAVVSYPVERLNTDSGREAVRLEIAAAAERYCRGNAVGHTVAGCRADVAKQLSQAMESHVRQYARSHPQVELAGR